MLILITSTHILLWTLINITDKLYFYHRNDSQLLLINIRRHIPCLNTSVLLWDTPSWSTLHTAYSSWQNPKSSPLELQVIPASKSLNISNITGKTILESSFPKIWRSFICKPWDGTLPFAHGTEWPNRFPKENEPPGGQAAKLKTQDMLEDSEWIRQFLSIWIEVTRHPL